MTQTTHNRRRFANEIDNRFQAPQGKVVLVHADIFVTNFERGRA